MAPAGYNGKQTEQNVEEIAMPEFVEVVSHAMGLPIEERADLAHRLIISLEEETTREQDSLEELLVARQRRMQSGNFVAYEASETLERIRQSLEQRAKS
jgi:hypothetical protein